ncbi:hypothetical protein [Massilia cavernae]|uniref:hypothetical protein n=1 Tax=Massilia cavernae TaxID=2320864 RepID=UPI0016025756|nr:hypothetical protein [Massilia cavernae]
MAGSETVDQLGQRGALEHAAPARAPEFDVGGMQQVLADQRELEVRGELGDAGAIRK